MYYGRKKGIIIAIVVVIILIVLAIAGTFVVLKTDLFKSNETLFWKYMNNAMEKTSFTQNTQLEDIEKLKVQNPYTTEGELIFNSTNEEQNDVLEKFKLITSSQTDKTENYSHFSTKLNYANDTLFNFDYAENDDVYAIKSDEIVSVYLGVKNENLNVLMQKLGIDNTKIIPEEGSTLNILELFKNSDEELKHIGETYYQVILDNISKENYSKETNAIIVKDEVSYTTTAYRLDLTENEISNLVVKMLETLKTDSITLNFIATKAKALNLNEQFTTIDGIVEMIDELIEEVSEQEYVDTSFVVYNYDGETIATEIIFKNTQKITISGDNQILNIALENLTEDAEYNMINIKLLNQATSLQTNMVLDINVDDEYGFSINITNIGTATDGSIQTDINVSFSQENETIEAIYTQTTEFVDEIEDKVVLDETNCAILNDYSKEQLDILMNALIEQTLNVYAEKIEIIGMNNSTGDIDITNIEANEEGTEIDNNTTEE